jgi:hypothetical protein
MGREEGTDSVMELAMYLEHWGPTSTSIDAVINLSSKGCEGERCVVLADVFTELLCLWCQC